MNNQLTKSKNNKLIEVHDRLSNLIEKRTDALPSDLNIDRFKQNAMHVVSEIREIENINTVSICRTILQGAFLGLDFLNRECYAIPYKGIMTFQTDYKGEVKLAKKYSIKSIRDVYSKLVREGDDFSEKIVEGKQTLDFTPQPFSTEKVKGAFAVCLYEDGSMIYETMSISDINSVRDNYSKSKNIWGKSPGEMQKKTVLRRLLKHVTLDFETIKQKETWDESSGFEFSERKRQKNQSAKSSLDQIIEVGE